MKKIVLTTFATLMTASIAGASVSKEEVADFNNLHDLKIVCDGREVNTGKYDDDIKIYRVATQSQIKYEVYSKDNGQLIVACDNIGLN